MLKILSKIASTFQIALHPKGGIGYLLKKNASIASFSLCNSFFDLKLPIASVIDVGANIGQFTGAICRFFPNTKVFSFEPLPECYDQLVLNVKDNKNITPFNIALSDFNGNLKFNKNNLTYASSALDITDYQKDKIPQTGTFSTITVACAKLDELDLPILRPTLLKLDVQGLEKKVLDGANKFIKNVDYILIETSFVPMYKDEPLFDEMHQYLTFMNFEIVAPIGFLQIGNNSIIQQLDILYKRKV
ncbi:FkbM family methyltransferase [Runella salmonicolor]|uniref:FkbM family methyltransferase n=1 Tax=Runella salmonicolor TaxID=2950278 RepID=A0ABT1FS88_9BACT|nr:FkbM family methyltransferase [Runella salmonicolor]MCP1384365.1 FkbM family methyltransferase [Runella salmonicolor]